MNTEYPKIYVDESGNTGSDIQNPTQKYFVLSAVCFTDEELDQLKKDFGYRKELHFVKMKQSIEGRTVIKKILQHPLIDENHISYQFIDKNYCTYALITDMVIEPVFYYLFKEDLYKKRGNMKLANCLYAFSEHHPYKDYIQDFKLSFEKMMRQQTPESIEIFFENVNILKEQTDNKSFKEILSLIVQSCDIIEDVLTEDHIYGLDMTMASLLNLVNHWGLKTKRKLDVITDNSKPLKAKEALIKRLMEINVHKIVGYDTRKSVYPIQIHTIKMVDSVDCFGVQLADLVASTVAFRYNDAGKYKIFQKEIAELSFFDIPCYPIRPATKEELALPIDDSDDNDPIEFLCNHLPYPLNDA